MATVTFTGKQPKRGKEISMARKLKLGLLEQVSLKKAWMVAAYAGSIETMERLLARHERKSQRLDQPVSKIPSNLLNACDKSGQTALNWAIKGGQIAMVDWLVSHGASVNVENNTSGFMYQRAEQPLLTAALTHDAEMVHKLMAYGADPNGKTGYLHPLLVEAVRQTDLEAARLLLEAGADPNAQQPIHLPQVLYKKSAQICKDFIDLLLEYGAKLDGVDEAGNNLLHKAAWLGSAEALEAVLSYPLNINKRNGNGNTPLFLAVAYGRQNADKVRILLKHGADPNMPNSSGVYPIETAVEIGSPEIVSMLLQRSRLNLSGKDGVLLLYEAMRQWNLPVAEILKAAGADPEKLNPAQRLFEHLDNPAAFLAQASQSFNQLDNQVLEELYRAIEFRVPVKIGLKHLPELMMLMRPFHRNLQIGQDLGIATAGMTRLFDFIHHFPRIDEVSGRAYENWAQIGTLGLSFSRWKFDSMQRWKNAGPMAQPSLLEKSGLFKQITPRPDDATYHRGFVHYDPTTGLSVEMRRAYTVISKQGLGTLVIRNSSHHFGRDLFPMPAYYSTHRVYTDEKNLFDPDTILKGPADPADRTKTLVGAMGLRMYSWLVPSQRPDFLHVLSKTLNWKPSQEKSHDKMARLLQEYDALMSQYVSWKCDFKDGQAPAGFEELLRTALMSAKGGGAASPFGKFKNLRLAWVNPHELPAPVLAYEMTTPAHQLEVQRYLDATARRQQIRTPEEYRQKMPDLMQFLNQGLSQGLELVLVE